MIDSRQEYLREIFNSIKITNIEYFMRHINGIIDIHIKYCSLEYLLNSTQYYVYTSIARSYETKFLLKCLLSVDCGEDTLKVLAGRDNSYFFNRFVNKNKQAVKKNVKAFNGGYVDVREIDVRKIDRNALLTFLYKRIEYLIFNELLSWA